nr:MAG TPA: hypothetical protein [Caudoviricetes sp.]
MNRYLRARMRAKRAGAARGCADQRDRRGR